MSVSPSGGESPHAPNARALLAAQNERAFLAAFHRLKGQDVQPTIPLVARATGMTYKVAHRIAVKLSLAGVMRVHEPRYRDSSRGLTGATPAERIEIAERKAQIDAERATRLREHPHGSHEAFGSPRTHRFHGPRLLLGSDPILDLYEPIGGGE